MRLLYVSHAIADASKGAANADLSLLAALRSCDHHVDDVWDIGSPRAIRHDNLHLLLEAPRKCEREIARRLAIARYDVVFVNQPLGWRAARAIRSQSLAPLFVARSHGWEPRVFEESRPYIASTGQNRLRTLASDVLRRLLHRQNRLLLQSVDGLVVCSRDDRDYVLATSTIAAERVLALPPGLPAEYLESPAPRLSIRRCHRLLYVGQLSPVKAPSVVAAAMAEILALRPEVQASWVCAERDHATVRALLPQEIRHRVTLLDWMPREDLLAVYDAHGIYLFPSFFEGFAQTFLEAMARGMAVFASRVDGMAQVICNRENGFLFERGRPNEMAEAAIALIDGKVDVDLLGREARRTVEDYTWPRSAKMFESFLSVLARDSR